MGRVKHKCARPDCDTMVNHGALHCRKHAIKTPEHVEKVAAASRGRKRTPEQRRILSLAKRGPGAMERTCEYCGKPFTAEKPSSKVRFCSRSCGYMNRRGENALMWRADMPTIICRVCGKPFRLHAASTARQRATCSYSCKGIWQKAHQKNKGTKIERAIEAALRERGWQYIAQYPLCNVTVTDFYLPFFGIAIFCDGDYWHQLPGRPEKDQRQTAVLEAAGYSVYRFTETDIKRSPQECLDRVHLPSKPLLRQSALPIA